MLASRYIFKLGFLSDRTCSTQLSTDFLLRKCSSNEFWPPLHTMRNDGRLRAATSNTARIISIRAGRSSSSCPFLHLEFPFSLADGHDHVYMICAREIGAEESLYFSLIKISK